MDTQPSRSPDASSADAADFPTSSEPMGAPDAPPPVPSEACPEPGRRVEGPKRIGWLEGHLPDLVDPLTPQHPETALTETRRLRHDGWTPEKKRDFLVRYAECGVMVEACEAVGMSARSAYNLRDRDPLFAAGMEAAQVMARPKLADEAYSRSLNGVVERIYKDGVIVAERHRYDNKLTMSVLNRLDQRIDRAEAQSAPHLALVARWDDYLAALAEDRQEDARALLACPEQGRRAGPAAAPAPTAAGEVHEAAPGRELHELRLPPPPVERDRHEVWEDEREAGCWWTDYPPPPDFDGEEEGDYGDEDYRRTLSSAEQAVIDADVAEEKAEELARAQAQRAAYFEDGPGEACPDSGQAVPVLEAPDGPDGAAA